jgi:hypothetical protein
MGVKVLVKVQRSIKTLGTDTVAGRGNVCFLSTSFEQKHIQVFVG